MRQGSSLYAKPEPESLGAIRSRRLIFRGTEFPSRSEGFPKPPSRSSLTNTAFAVGQLELAAPQSLVLPEPLLAFHAGCNNQRLPNVNLSLDKVGVVRAGHVGMCNPEIF